MEKSNRKNEFEILGKNAFSIREYKKEDKAQIIKILRLNTPESFHPSEEIDLKQYLEKEAQHYFVVEGLDSILGAGGFNLGFDEGKTARVSWDLVHPEFKGLGIGRALTYYRIERIKKYAVVEKILVRTTTQAEKFYEKMGFQKRHFEKDFWAPGFDLCEMEMKV